MPQILPSLMVHAREARVGASVTRRFEAPAAVRLWHLSSLDAPTVAVAWTLGFAWAAGVRLPVWIPVLLALGAWAVYIADRLMDVRRAMRADEMGGLRERHRFHYKHRWILGPMAVVAACCAAAIVLTLMPVAARERNSVLAMAAVAYFTRVHGPGTKFSESLSRFVKKEMLVGILFTAACALPAMARAAEQNPRAVGWLGAAAGMFALVAWLNCHAIESWESADGPGGFRVGWQGGALGVVGLGAAGVVLASQPRCAGLLAAGAASSLLLGLLDRVRGKMTPVALRAAADLVLLTPLVLLAR